MKLRHLIITLICLGLSYTVSAGAYDKKQRRLHEQVIDTQAYPISHVAKKRAMLRAIVPSEWEVLEQDHAGFLLGYKIGRMRIDIEPDRIVMREVRTRARFNVHWTSGLAGHFLKFMAFETYALEAIAIHGDDPQETRVYQ